MSNHHLQDKMLSLKAKGLLSYMLSLPDDWDYSLKGLTVGCKDGLDSVRTAVLELEEHGYVVRTQLRDENGRMSRSHYEVYEIPEMRKPSPEIPSSEKPTTVNPIPVSPSTDNPTQINTKSNYSVVLKKSTG